MQKWIIFIVIGVIIAIGTFVVINLNVETEYVPEGEIKEEEFRKTLVTLYFKDKENGEIVSETRLIDSKELLLDPYEKLINLLIQGPANEKNEKIIPDEIKLLNTDLKNGYVIITLSDNFISEDINDEKRNMIGTSIYYTLSNLTEVNGIKIKVGDEVVEEIPLQ